MKKNLKVVTINGITGLVLTLFIIFGLISGFIISPSWVCMKLWNTFIVSHFHIMNINLYQGLLIWSIIALLVYVLNSRCSLISFGAYHKLTNEQIKDIINKSKNSSDIMSELENMHKNIQKDAAMQVIINQQEIKKEKEEE